MRSLLLLCLLMVVTACGGTRASTRASTRPSAMSESEYLRSRALMVPVHGVERDQLRDTFTAPRSGGRAHLALDIRVPKGTRVVSADDGIILRITENALGGKVIYMTDPNRRFVYYYAHLDEWKYGLVEGQNVRRGQLLGTVGTTGNAPANAPHLHFQLMRMGTANRYWSGEPINPIPYLRQTGRER